VANNSRLAWKLTGRVFSGPRGGIAVRIRRPSSRNRRAAARFVLQLARQGIIRPGARPHCQPSRPGAELASGTEKRPIDQGHGAGANSWL